MFSELVPAYFWFFLSIYLQNNSLIKTKNKLLEQLKKLSKIHSELNEENIEEILYLLIHNINTHPHTFLNTIIDENFFKYALYNMSTKKKQNRFVTKKEDQKENKKEKIDSASEKTIESETITSKDLLAFYIKTVLEIFEN